MKSLVAAVVTLFCCASFASAQTECPVGHPATPWPGPLFVPDATCTGWVPHNHPLAPTIAPVAPPSGQMPPASLVAQSIYTALELPTTASASAGGLRLLRGWAVDCSLGSFPPVGKIIETKPDGSTRELPLDFFFSSGQLRGDVQAAIGGACPAVYAAPASDGVNLGPNAAFGWSVQLRSPITELGAHTFTAIWSWPAQGHSGSSSVVVTIVP